MPLRPMVEADLKAVSAIEKSATQFPWPMSQFHGSLVAGNDCTVLESDSGVCGFIIFSRVMDETTLLNIAVSPAMQGRGYGRYLLEYGLSQQHQKGASQCFLEVRVSNTRAQALYQSLQFQVVGERKNYYPAKTGREDALVMCRHQQGEFVN